MTFGCSCIQPQENSEERPCSSMWDRPAVLKVDWKKDDKCLLEFPCNILVPLESNEKRWKKAWPRDFYKVTATGCDELLALKRKKVHLITKDEFNQMSLTLHNSIKSDQLNKESLEKILGDGFFVFIKIDHEYSKLFYDEILKYLSELLDGNNYEQIQKADKYMNIIFTVLYCKVRHIQENNKKDKCEGLNGNLSNIDKCAGQTSSYLSQGFPGNFSLREFLESCISRIEKLFDVGIACSIAVKNAASLDVDTGRITHVYSFVDVELPKPFQENLKHIEKKVLVLRENKEMMRTFTRDNGYSDNSNISTDMLYYSPDEWQFFMVIFQAMQDSWSELRENKEFINNKEKLTRNFNNALHQRLLRIPVFPYLLGNRFSTILPQTIKIDKQNEILTKIMEWSQSSFRIDFTTLDQLENFMRLMIDRFTSSGQGNYRLNEDKTRLPYHQCEDKIKLYAQEHNIEKLKNTSDIFKTLWDHSENNSGLFYQIFFDVLVPKKFKEAMLEDSNDIEKQLKKRLEIEQLFAKYFIKRVLEVPGQVVSAMQSFPVLFIYEFVNLFTMYAHRAQKEMQKNCLEFFKYAVDSSNNVRHIWTKKKVNTVDSPTRLRTFVYNNLTSINDSFLNEDLKFLCTDDVEKISMSPELKAQNHPNIVKIYGCVVDEQQMNGILMEYCEGGSLDKVINSSQLYSDSKIIHWVAQAACGLDFLHFNGIIHCDVKPANMLLDASHKYLKISDLGVAKLGVIDKSTKQGTGSFEQTVDQGTYGYIAPEVQDDTIKTHISAIDVFSLGRSVWNMIYRCTPTDELVCDSFKTFPDAPLNIKKQSINISEDIWNFSKKMMVEQPGERPSMEDVFKFFKPRVKKSYLSLKAER